MTLTPSAVNMFHSGQKVFCIDNQLSAMLSYNLVRSGGSPKKALGYTLSALPSLHNTLGTRIQSAAWDHASPFIIEYLARKARAIHSRFNKLLDLDSESFARLSLADGIVLVQLMGLNEASSFVGSVDPWYYPGEQTPEYMFQLGSSVRVHPET